MEVYFKEDLEKLYNIDKKELNRYLYNKFGKFSDKLCYGIHNLSNNMWYIGSTLNGIYQRFWRCWDTAHFKCIENNSHDFLTTDNISDFELVILWYDETDSIDWSSLRNLETEYISKYDSYNSGYNKTPIAQAGFYGKVHTDDEKERIKISLAKTNEDPEVKKRRSESSKNVWNRPGYRESRKNNPNCRGFKYSEENLLMRSNITKGRSRWYSCSFRKVFFVKDEEIPELLLKYPDLRKGGPDLSVRNKDKKDWWNDPRWNKDIN